MGGCPVFVPSFSLSPARLLLASSCPHSGGWENPIFYMDKWECIHMIRCVFKRTCKERTQLRVGLLTLWPLFSPSFSVSDKHTHFLAASLALHLTLSVSQGDKANLRLILPLGVNYSIHTHRKTHTTPCFPAHSTLTTLSSPFYRELAPDNYS